ncbi:MAG: phospho-N-acetylmuramoyl-pentapeptide-transferase [Vulcanimicrobiaceae bacterium]
MELTASIVAAFSFIAARLLGRPLIAMLRSASAKQIAYEDAPQTHQTKTGTPTMGGLLFLIAPAVALAAAPTLATLAMTFLFAACALIGAVDDTMAIRLGRNRGLRARTKLLLTGVVAAAFAFMLLDSVRDSSLIIFGLGYVNVTVYVLLSILAIVATTHAVNLTDGLDGLAAGTIVPPLIVIAYVAFAQAQLGVGIFECAVIGTVVGFLAFNVHPAKVFMGDTGSLALGAALAGGAAATGMQLLLILIGGVFAAEALSVILQVASYKMTKKRIFRMSPLHHHFEMGGWPETKVTTRFWVASLLCSIAGFALVRVAL